MNVLRLIPGFRSNTKWKKGSSLKKVFIPFVLSLLIMVGSVGCTTDNPDSKQVTQAGNQSGITSQVDDFNKAMDTNKEILKEEPEVIAKENENNSDTNITIIDGNIEVHFIDVGQADSVLIKEPSGKTMLIDAGNNGDRELIHTYLINQGIETVDVAIGTHPHEDHIGGLDTVINNFNIGKVYMPKVSHNSQTFEDVLVAIQNKGLKITTPTPGDEFYIGSAKCTILGPNNSSYSNFNNYSIVIKLEYGDTSFLFTGDTEIITENEILNKGYNLKADVLKVSHHGSDTSSSDKFIKAVAPKHAIISVGKGTQYGHPDNIVLERLRDHKINIYRTDEDGTIIVTSDGENITINKDASSIITTSPPPTTTETKTVEQKVTPTPTAPVADEVYITNTGSKYHRSSCSSLNKSKIAISLDKAKSGYGPCGRCNPPQ